MKIDANLVKKLREISGAGMLEVKKALVATKGEIDKAVAYLKEKGLSNAEKKLDKIAADGLVGILANNNKAVIMELNCETDFVALTDDFKNLLNKIMKKALSEDISTIDEINDSLIDSIKVSIYVKELSAKIGEKIHLRRFKSIHKTDNETFGAYTHSNGKIASIVVINKGNEEVAKNISMHLSAMNPKYMTSKEITPDKLKEYKETILKDMVDMKKPMQIKEKIAEGKMRKILSEIVFVDQSFVMDNKKSINQYLKENKSSFIKATRYEVGEGIEKNISNFADEVKSQMK